MSMNLNASYDGKTINLWQTPTSISEMCCMQDSGAAAWDLTGKRAKRALFCYLRCVDGHTDGVWNNDKEFDDMLKRCQEHRQKIEQYFKKRNLKKLNVWIM